MPGDRDDDVVYLSRNLLQVRIYVEIGNLPATGTDGVYRSGESGGEQCLDPERAHVCRVRGCADDGDGSGVEDGLELLKLILKQDGSSRVSLSGQRPDSVVCTMPGSPSPCLEYDPRINRHRPVGVGEYGVEVEFLYLGVLLHELRHLHYQLL